LVYNFPLANVGGSSYSSFTMANYKTIYKCRDCGSTSYQPVIGRVESGALLPTGQYKCTGCRNVFATIRSWWEPRRNAEFQPSKFSSA
jgi:DNA-directed RNA polymerase subunit RPC12/RpoP